MASNREPVRRPAPARRGGGGGGWLFVLLIVAAVAAIYVFAPWLPQRIFGRGAKPSEGPDPIAPQDSHTHLDDRKVDTVAKITAPSTFDRSGKAPVPVIDTHPVAKPPDVKPVAPDEPAAQKALAQAEDAYRTFQWDKAVSAATQIAALDAKPATKVRAKDIVRGATALKSLFKELDDRDELSRNYDTHPSLLAIESGGRTNYGVPIVSLENHTVVEKDPIGWVNSQRKVGQVTLMMRGSKDFIPTSLQADKVGEVKPVDLAAVRTEKLAEFNARLDRLKNGDMAGEALAWYDAAKFAYRNRLDEHVTEMMDQAIVLDPMLVASVREDKASGLFAEVVLRMKNNNTKQAAAFINIINKRFADTPSGKQARLFYDGKQTELLAAARQAEADAHEADRQRREARIARAKELGDDKAADKIATEPEHTVASISAPVSGNEATADAFFGKGKDLYQQAIDAGNSDARDGLYAQACEQFTKAMGIYNKLLEKAGEDSGVAMKALECNKLRFGSIKQRRFH